MIDEERENLNRKLKSVSNYSRLARSLNRTGGPYYSKQLVHHWFTRGRVPRAMVEPICRYLGALGSDIEPKDIRPDVYDVVLRGGVNQDKI